MSKILIIDDERSIRNTLKDILEFEKHNREMKKVKRFLRDKSQKNGFEIYLMQHYDGFYNKALEATENLKDFANDLEAEYIDLNGPVCHGDFQYHNLLNLL